MRWSGFIDAHLGGLTTMGLRDFYRGADETSRDSRYPGGDSRDEFVGVVLYPAMGLADCEIRLRGAGHRTARRGDGRVKGSSVSNIRAKDHRYPPHRQNEAAGEGVDGP